MQRKTRFALRDIGAEKASIKVIGTFREFHI
jgi:hypothetical protein